MNKLFTSVLFIFDHNKKDPAKSNMLYICVFILLTLSSSRDFCLKLNEQYAMKLPFDLEDHVPSTYGNLMIEVISRAIRVGPSLLKPLYKSLISIISNSAPYAKNLSKASSEAILELFKKFSKPSFLKESEGNCKILTNLCEGINYILQYHDDGNEVFLFHLMEEKKFFAYIRDINICAQATQEGDHSEKLEDQDLGNSTSKPEEVEETKDQINKESLKEEEKEVVEIPLETNVKDNSAEETKAEESKTEFLTPEWEETWK